MIAAGVTLFCGQSRTGKTRLALRELHGQPRRALIFDPSRDPAFHRFRALESPADVAAWFRAWASWARAWTVTVRGPVELYAHVARIVPQLCGVVWLCDEPAVLQDRTVRAVGEAVALSGRHFPVSVAGEDKGVELWVCSPRPMSVPPDIRSQAQRVFSFYQDEPRDVAYLREKAGVAFAERVRTLGAHQFAAWPEPAAVATTTGRRLRLVRSSHGG